MLNSLIINAIVFVENELARSTSPIATSKVKSSLETHQWETYFPPQMSIGQRDIADIQIDVSSRDDIPVIFLGLQHIFTTKPLKDAVFKILEEVAPTKMDNDVTKIVSINKGCPGMDQWSILVLGSLRVGLNARLWSYSGTGQPT